MDIFLLGPSIAKDGESLISKFFKCFKVILRMYKPLLAPEVNLQTLTVASEAPVRIRFP